MLSVRPLAVYSSSPNGTTVFRPSLPPLSCTTTRMRSSVVAIVCSAEAIRKSRARGARTKSAPTCRPRSIEIGDVWCSWRLLAVVFNPVEFPARWPRHAAHRPALRWRSPLVEAASATSRWRVAAGSGTANSRAANQSTVSSGVFSFSRSTTRPACRQRNAFPDLEDRAHQVGAAQQRGRVDPRAAAVPAFHVGRVKQGTGPVPASDGQTCTIGGARRAPAASPRPASTGERILRPMRARRKTTGCQESSPRRERVSKSPLRKSSGQRRNASAETISVHRDEETHQLAGDELWRGRLLEDDFHPFVAVEIARLARARFRAIVVLVRALNLNSPC